MSGDGVSAAQTDPELQSEHVPLRPLWLCRACGQPWPCGRAKLALLNSYQGSRLNLLLYLSGCLQEAIDDLHRLNPSTTGDVRNLFDRFLGWPDRHRRRPPIAGPQTLEET
ncbi:hypothetical protein ACLQ24_16520 [Micromonospora sp. DT4]|uniref:hypothetical protein n=1 Tax=Micromonospora sp. DT4 TaxID=3393438 RepID=UPI003CEC9BCF